MEEERDEEEEEVEEEVEEEEEGLFKARRTPGRGQAHAAPCAPV